MTSPPSDGEVVARLPFQVRPVAGEGGRSFIVRLAKANHLRPAYLRKYLVDPPWRRGSPSWHRLAAVTGREPEMLRAVLETRQCKECGTPIPPGVAFGNRATYCSSKCRARPYRRNTVTAPCRICRQPMTLRPGQRHRLCSSSCRRTAYLARHFPRLAETHAAADGNRNDTPETFCIACEQPLPAAPPSSPGRRRRTCSPACAKRAVHWNQVAARREEPPRAIAACGFCGKPMPSTAFAGPIARKWCSGRCRMRAKRGHDPAAYGPLTCGHCHNTFDRGPGKGRRWCSPECHEAATKPTFKNIKPVPEPIPPPQPVLSTQTFNCPSCHESFQTGPRGCPWCSEDCWSHEVEARAADNRCGICDTSMADRTPDASRRWCSPLCRQQALRWRHDLRTRA